jgi:GNAT superfamily N-acetyltransferase
VKPDASSPPVEYLVLDAVRLRAEPERFDRLLADFAAGYETMFHGDEAESHDAWRARIAGMAPPQPVMRIAVAVQRDGDAEEVIGGAASEYYRASGCVLCTYLYVLDRPEHRHRGHARALLKASVQACAPLGPVHAVLAEVEWPQLLPPDRFGPEAVAIARARLRFFERIGARLLAFDYVQPALGPARQPVPWLRLVLPTPTGEHDEPVDESALRRALDRFLPEFHAALAQDSGRPVDATLLAAQRARVGAAKLLSVSLDAD